MKAMKQPLSPKVAPQRDVDNHVIYVDRGRVAYDGRGGNDVIAGYQDNDTLKGGDGDDVAMLSPNQTHLADRTINDSTWRRAA